MLEQVRTAGGVQIEFQQQLLAYENAIEPLLTRLDSHRGALFASSFEYPGRYTCWDIGFCNPPLVLTCIGTSLQVEALNKRGEVLLQMLLPLFTSLKDATTEQASKSLCLIHIQRSDALFSEEERSRQPSVFSILRAILAFFKSDEEPYLGLYGAFGYDLIFQFETLHLVQERLETERNMVLYLPDEIIVVNHRKEEAFIRRYDFQYHGISTEALPRDGAYEPYEATKVPVKDCDHAPKEYAEAVLRARERFACGDLFEVVLSQTFYRPFEEKPSTLFRRMREKNPSPYGFFMHLGEQEYLVGASPEMYVRVQGTRVETCPISGTIKRGADAMEDASNIQSLLMSEKETSELTMCTDVDRNDKSRICEAGSVQVIGRRQIEMYSRVIHTVDHVEGRLREGFDALDAFLTHMWVVTVTGAPKVWAMNFIEQQEKTPRRWYGGAVGWLQFNGNLNTGLILRTVRIEQGVAEVRVGATLLYDSVPEAEEEETRLKASAFLELLDRRSPQVLEKSRVVQNGLGRRILLVDHQDSFVHTLANYLRQTGAVVTTVRYDNALTYLEKETYHGVLLSPGPGKPSDFQLSKTIDAVVKQGIPLFGVCLGLQGIVEYFGGVLAILPYPIHGKPSIINVASPRGLFKGFEPKFTAGRYHSLYAELNHFPSVLEVTARSEDHVVMGIAHRELPIHAVQFHPETILSLPRNAGMRIITNLMDLVNDNVQ